MYLLLVSVFHLFFFFFKQKTAYEMRISDWSSDVCSSDLADAPAENVVAADPQDDADRAEHQQHDHRGQHGTRRDALARRLERRLDTRAEVAPVGRLVHEGLHRADGIRSEEHTSELQSLLRISSALYCLKKQQPTTAKD